MNFDPKDNCQPLVDLTGLMSKMISIAMMMKRPLLITIALLGILSSREVLDDARYKRTEDLVDHAAICAAW